MQPARNEMINICSNVNNTKEGEGGKMAMELTIMAFFNNFTKSHCSLECLRQ